MEQGTEISEIKGERVELIWVTIGTLQQNTFNTKSYLIKLKHNYQLHNQLHHELHNHIPAAYKLHNQVHHQLQNHKLTA